jgi:hypothetical protein
MRNLYCCKSCSYQYPGVGVPRAVKVVLNQPEWRKGRERNLSRGGVVQGGDKRTRKYLGGGLGKEEDKPKS